MINQATDTITESLKTKKTKKRKKENNDEKREGDYSLYSQFTLEMQSITT